MQKKTLDEKLARILETATCEDFILADAKDADMAFGIAAPGKNQQGSKCRTLQEYRDTIRENTKQGLIDIMLMSASSNEILTVNERLFDNSPVTPAIRANDSTDIWQASGGIYSEQPSLPFRTTSIENATCRNSACTDDTGGLGADLGLYSVTFNNDATRDALTLSAYREFCLEAEQKGLRHFLEVFDPNYPVNPVEDVGAFVNDHIARALAGVVARCRPQFLKMVYHGPASLEQLVSYDSTLVVGILGGSSGTTFDAFCQLWEAKKYGARVALYGRMINNSEHQLSFIQHLRYLADGELNDPVEAVRSYHGTLQDFGIQPFRTLENDLQLTNRYVSYSSRVRPTSLKNLGHKPELKKPDPEIIVAGHICLDIIPNFPHTSSDLPMQIEPGKLKVIGPAACITGGCVANTGLTLHQLGIQTSLMGKIGDDPFGEQILCNVRKADASIADSMIITPGEHSSYSIVISLPGVDRSFLHFPAANNTFTANDVRLEQLKNAKLFHFGYPTLMQRFWEDGGVEMARLFCSVKEIGAMTSLDMAMPDPTTPAGKIDWKAWLDQVLPHVDLFMPSLEEILFMLDSRQYYNTSQPENLEQEVCFDSELLTTTADQLLALGAGIVVLKLGSKGLYLKTSTEPRRISRAFYPGKSNIEAWVSRELYSPCFEVPVVSTNGAGDRTIAGFLAALVRDLNPVEALQMAVAVGAISVESPDISETQFSWESINKRVSNGWNRQPVESSVSEEFICNTSGCWLGSNDQTSIRRLVSALPD